MCHYRLKESGSIKLEVFFTFWDFKSLQATLNTAAMILVLMQQKYYWSWICMSPCCINLFFILLWQVETFISTVSALINNFDGHLHHKWENVQCDGNQLHYVWSNRHSSLSTRNANEIGKICLWMLQQTSERVKDEYAKDLKVSIYLHQTNQVLTWWTVCEQLACDVLLHATDSRRM